jgi:gliding motility-associated-like protein
VFDTSLVITIKPAPPKPNITVLSKPIPCRGDSVVLRINNPEPNTRYRWNTGDSTLQLTIRQTGLYAVVQAENTVGCFGAPSDTVAVAFSNAPVPEPPTLSTSALVEICPGAQATLSVNAAAGTTIWSNGTAGAIISTGAGSYYALQQSAEGCQSAPSDTITVAEVPLSKVQLVVADSFRCPAHEEEKSYHLTTANVETKSIMIEGGTLLVETDSTITIRWQADENALLTITHRNRLGCAEVPVTFSPKTDLANCRKRYPLSIPNLVTANGDDKNDLFALSNLFYHRPVSLHIYNRWGKLLYHSSDYANNWPENTLKPGTYYYRITTIDGKTHQGWVEVVR